MISIDVPTVQRGAGTYTSEPLFIGLDETGWIRVTARDISTQDYENPLLGFIMRTFKLDPATNIWKAVNPVLEWHGGAYFDTDTSTQNPAPWAQTAVNDVRGCNVRLELQVLARMRFGARIETRVSPE